MSQSDDDKLLGEELLSTGRISSEALLAALDVQRRLGGPTRQSVGVILVDQGHLSMEGLQNFLADQTKQLLWCSHCHMQVIVKATISGDPHKCQSCRGELSAATPPSGAVMNAAKTDKPISGAEPLPDDVSRAMADPSRRVGRYVLLSVLGRGGMGVVYRGYDPMLRREVAIKTIIADRSADQVGRARFLREAQACAELRHPGIVAIHEAGEQDGQPYLVMDLVKGQLLTEVIENQGHSLRGFVGLMRKIALALDHAHKAGIIHRDIKPDNIMVSEEGQPLLMDFGLAKRSSAQQQLTQSGEALGTPLYMAPEQIMAKGPEVGPWTDVYGLGVVLYVGLTGSPPFEAPEPVSLFRAILMDEVPSPRSRNPAVTPDLETITLKCLEKQPLLRYRSAAALAQDLQHFLDGQAISARPTTRMERSIRWVRRNRALSAAMVIVLAVVVIAGALLASERSDRQESDRNLREQVMVLRKADRKVVMDKRRDVDERERRDAEEKDRHRKELSDQKIAKSRTSTYNRKSDRGRLHLKKVMGRGTWKHLSMVTCVRWSPDGGLAVSGALDGTLSVWEVASGDEVRTFNFDDDTHIRAVAFTADSERVVAGDNHGMLWELDVDTGRRECWQAGKEIDEIAVLEGDKILVCGKSGLRLWDLSDRTVLQRFESGDDPTFDLDVSADGALVLASSRDAEKGAIVRLWNVETGKVQRWFPAKEGEVWVAISPDGTRGLFGGKGELIEHVDLDTGKTLPTLEARGSGWVRNIDISPDGTRALGGGNDGKLRLWDLYTGKQDSEVLEGHITFSHDVAFDPDGTRALSGGNDQTVRRWNLEKPYSEQDPDPGHPSKVYDMALTADGKRLLSVGYDGTPRLWNVATGEEAGELQAVGVPITAAAVSQDGRFALTGSQLNHVIYWDLNTGKALWTSRRSQSTVQTVAISSGGERGLIGTSDGRLVLRDLQTGDILQEFKGAGVAVVATSFLDSEHALVVDQNGGVFLLDLGDKAIGRWNVPGGIAWYGDPNNRLFVHPSIDGRQVLAVSHDRRVHLLALDQGEARIFEEVPRDIRAVALSRAAGGRWLSAHSDGVRLWDVATEEMLDYINLTDSNDYVCDLAFTPSGDGFVAGTLRGVILRYDIRD